jgi:hypothetical protein
MKKILVVFGLLLLVDLGFGKEVCEFLLFYISLYSKCLVFKPRGRFFDKKFRLLVEDFYSKTNVEQQTQIDELLIGISLANQTNGNSRNFYSTAFSNLKNIVPNLESLTIDGGYILKPAFGVCFYLIPLNILFLDGRGITK